MLPGTAGWPYPREGNHTSNLSDRGKLADSYILSLGEDINMPICCICDQPYPYPEEHVCPGMDAPENIEEKEDTPPGVGSRPLPPIILRASTFSRNFEP